MKLLVIEDDTKVANVLAEAFMADGHEVTVRYSGEDGLDYLEGDRPDAVVLDIRLPRMNGVEVLREIRGRDTRLPVIIISGYGTAEELAEARRLGVTEIISKPYVLKHFGEALARATRGRSADRPDQT